MPFIDFFIKSGILLNMEQKKSAFIAIIGRPSAGKSTLLNRICGEKVAIVSSVPQTTRNAIRGIVNRKEGQLVFIDTPGRHNSQKKINKKLMDVSNRAVEDADLALYVIDATRAPGLEEEEITSFVGPYAQKTIVAVNKTDLPEADLRRAHDFLALRSPSLLREHQFAVSAETGDGVEGLLSALYAAAPQGDILYSEEYYTDQPPAFRIAEIIREQAILRLRQELPHCLYVDIADMELKESNLWIRAFIVVERESQKGMVVGKDGGMIKKIRLASITELKKIFEWKIDLDLRVKTGKDWRHNDDTLRKLINDQEMY
jgi:GTP-binding protein Era